MFLSCSRPPQGGDDGEVVILFTGDVLLDRGVRPTAEKRGVGYLFEEVQPYFEEADAVVINLECPLTDTVLPVNKQYIFRADADWASELRRVGVTHAALANNHTIDQGRGGLRDTHRHLCDAGITPMGYGLSQAERFSPTVISKSGQHIAIFNALDLPLENWLPAEDAPDICQATGEQLAQAVHEYHSAHPETRIAVVLHWGTEFQTLPTIHQRRMARRLSDAGADAIIGHHPHVLQPIDSIGSTLVFYSLGNFVFDQQPPLARTSMMARLHFRAGEPVAWDTISVQIVGNRPVVKEP